MDAYAWVVLACCVALAGAAGCCPPAPDGAGPGDELELNLTVGDDPLWVNKMPPLNLRKEQEQRLTLRVAWAGPGAWEGQAPTAQLHDFTIERGGALLWRWSEGRVFAQVVTPVRIEAGKALEFSGAWRFHPSEIESEGTYTARAVFVPTGQETTRDFEVRFAY